MNRIRTGVIPAAGKGVRISELPYTRILPKPMLPVINKPILEHIIDNMKRVGIKIIYLIVSEQNDSIKKYFADGGDFGVDIKYIEQDHPKGIAHAISLVKEHVREPFMVILGDDFTVTPSLNGMVRTFFQTNCIVVEACVEDENSDAIKRACNIIADKDGKILDIIEKPEHPVNRTRGCGLYIFDERIFDYIDKTPETPPKNEREITNTIKLVALDNLAYCSQIEGRNININTLADLRSAIELALKNERQ